VEFFDAVLSASASAKEAPPPWAILSGWEISKPGNFSSDSSRARQESELTSCFPPGVLQNLQEP